MAPFNRATDTQKCIRAGGKHNDLEDVGFDTYHHTFFEMLGNWSFGNYFKKEAIEWAWELLVDRWNFPANRLYATVYKPEAGDPAEFDQEAHILWTRIFESAGLDPEIHVVSGGKKDNFWMMGETGPCGPCSELHLDLTPEGNSKGELVNADSHLCIEIWNLVFIQFNADRDGNFSPLAAQHVDTGMGFERVAAVLQATQGFTDFSKPTSNYDTDVFFPIFEKLSELSGKSYESTLPRKANLPMSRRKRTLPFESSAITCGLSVFRSQTEFFQETVIETTLSGEFFAEAFVTVELLVSKSLSFTCLPPPSLIKCIPFSQSLSKERI